jgi:hypothetical protein
MSSILVEAEYYILYRLISRLPYTKKIEGRETDLNSESNGASILQWPSIWLLTYWWSWALLDELPILQLLKNFPAFYGTRGFITVD